MAVSLSNFAQNAVSLNIVRNKQEVISNSDIKLPRVIRDCDVKRNSNKVWEMK
jgi:hypothetical protein